MTRSFRIGVDVGGTFTDIVFQQGDGTIHTRKCPSTPDDYSRGMLDGILGLLDDLGGRPAEIVEVVHATTVATNAILEGRGARTALVTTRGFRDVVEIGRLRVPVLYDLGYEKPTPLVPRRRRHEVSERMAADGSVVTALDEAALDGIADQIATDGARAVAVSFLHSYANPSHEQRAVDRLRARLGDDVFVCGSSDVLPEIREYERTSTVVVNAYLGPVVRSYLAALLRRLRAAGIDAPLQIMQSSGGVMNAASAMEKPACIIESGPAAGVIAAAHIGTAGQDRDLITIDMGGTTAKAAIVENGQPARTTEYEVGAGINVSSKLIKGGGHAVKLPFIDVSEIGAGGGSIVRVDPGGLIQVGPDSAGAAPGPVCYNMGGTAPTLTDALVVLGYVNPDYIAGGAVRLHARRSHAALHEHVAGPAGLSALAAAHGVFTIAAATMMRAVKAVSTYRGRDPRDFALYAFGGNGPVVACEIAEMLEMRRVLVPPSPGVFSALGLLYATTQYEILQTLFGPLDTMGTDTITKALRTVDARARVSLVAEGYAPDDIATEWQADLRYTGQAFELTVPVELDPTGRVDIASLATRFHHEHEQTYGHAAPGQGLELVNVRVVGRSRSQDQRDYRPLPPQPRRAVPGFALPVLRDAYFGPEHGLIQTRVIGRIDLASGPAAGPVIVEEYDSTCVVRPGWTASLDALGNVVMTKEPA